MWSSHAVYASYTYQFVFSEVAEEQISSIARKSNAWTC